MRIRASTVCTNASRAPRQDSRTVNRNRVQPMNLKVVRKGDSNPTLLRAPAFKLMNLLVAAD